MSISNSDSYDEGFGVENAVPAPRFQPGQPPEGSTNKLLTEEDFMDPERLSGNE